MRSLQGKLVAFVVGLIAVSVLVLGGLFYQQLRGQLLNAVTAETRSAATGYAFAIGEWVSAKSQLIRAAKPVITAADAEKQFKLLANGGGFDLVYAGYPPRLCRLSGPANSFFRAAAAAARLRSDGSTVVQGGGERRRGQRHRYQTVPGRSVETTGDLVRLAGGRGWKDGRRGRS